MKIDIISDTVCPWCFVGKRRLEQALDAFLAAHPNVPVELAWRPFQLNPDMPVEGMDRRAYIEAKFGGLDAANEVYARASVAGADSGIDFAFDRIARMPNSLQSHRLIHWCEERAPDLVDEIVEALFTAFFIDGRDIGDEDVLTAIGAGAGLPGDEVRAFLAGDKHRDEVADADAEARRIGVTGVPCFIVDRRYAVMGAQPPEALMELFERVLEERLGDEAMQDDAGNGD